MRYPFLFAAVIACLVWMGCDKSTPVELEPPESGIAGDGRLQEILEFLLQDHEVPALGAIVVQDGQTLDFEVAGVRSEGHDDPVTRNDKWHIGGITQTITSTLAAAMVEDNRLSWNLKIGPTFADLENINEAYNDIRLDELLAHTGGVISSIPNYELYFSNTDPVSTQRMILAEEVLLFPPEADRGVHHYSDANYILAGTMMEIVTGQTWESLAQEYVFDPLGLSSAGFGVPGTPGQRDQPWGHSYDFQRQAFITIDPGNPFSDHAPVVGPAGRVHMTLSDIATYLQAHLDGANGIDGFISSQSFVTLHTPPENNEFALGWDVDGGLLISEGSNTLWLAQVLASPSQNLAIVAVTNSAAGRGKSAVDDLMLHLTARTNAGN